MNPAQRAELVTKAQRFDRAVRKMTTQLNAIKMELICDACEGIQCGTLNVQETEGGGQSIQFLGKGDALKAVAIVTFPARSLKSAIQSGKTLDKIKALLAPDPLEALFETEVVWNPIPEFRKTVKLLMPEKATRLIKLCETDSKPTVRFATKEVAS
jgi:hypothetical protein